MSENEKPKFTKGNGLDETLKESLEDIGYGKEAYLEPHTGEIMMRKDVFTKGPDSSDTQTNSSTETPTDEEFSQSLQELASITEREIALEEKRKNNEFVSEQELQQEKADSTRVIDIVCMFLGNRNYMLESPSLKPVFESYLELRKKK